MSFDFAIYRFGTLTQVAGDADRGLRRPPLAELEPAFSDFRRRISQTEPYRDALSAIEKAARAGGDAAARLEQRNPPHEDDQITIFSMPPVHDPALEAEIDDSSHLVGLLPSERLHLVIDEVAWIVRVRASVTACSLEMKGGLSKIWWSFEGVPKDADPSRRPSETNVANFFKFIYNLESPTISSLNRAYFAALGEVARSPGIEGQLADERLRIRFADNNDVTFTALIDALQFRKMTPSNIARARIATLQPAKSGLRQFRKFVSDTNTPEANIDASTTYAEAETQVPGISTVAARTEGDGGIAIAGLAQRPGTRTAYDRLANVQSQLAAENEERRVRSLSASRRWTGHLLGYEALRLQASHRRRQRGEHHPGPSLN